MKFCQSNLSDWRFSTSLDLFRSLDDINTVLEFAKLERSDVKSEIQSVFFSSDLDNEAIKLLEMDDNVLDSLQEGRRSVYVQI